jgi:hypothetical protein
LEVDRSIRSGRHFRAWRQGLGRHIRRHPYFSEQFGRDVAVVASFRHQTQHLELATGEPKIGRSRLADFGSDDVEACASGERLDLAAERLGPERCGQVHRNAQPVGRRVPILAAGQSSFRPAQERLRPTIGLTNELPS